jgi:hypothetical protein
VRAWPDDASSIPAAYSAEAALNNAPPRPPSPKGAADMSTPGRYDLVILGCGPAGEKADAQAAYFGKRVAVIDPGPIGGAVVHTGTLPSVAVGSGAEASRARFVRATAPRRAGKSVLMATSRCRLAWVAR